MTSYRISPDDLLKRGLSANTTYTYLRILARCEAFLEQRGSTIPEASAEDIRAFAATLPRSHARLSQLRGALSHAWDIESRREAPVWAIRTPRRPRGRCRALTEAEAESLEAVCRDRSDRRGLAVLFGLYAALRRAEIAELRADSFLAGEHGPREWVRVVGKGDVTADVPVHPELRAELDRFEIRDGYVFPGTGRDHVTPATIWEWTRLLADEAGITNVTPHRLRHTALAEALDRSHDLRTVQEFARHSRPETTARYTRVSGRRLAEVVSLVDYRRRDQGCA